jgi:DNA-binding XRE family transcriptional regulator
MNALTNVQVIHQGGQPAFVVIAYQDYMNDLKNRHNDATVPHAVVSLMIDEEISIFKAWRIYKKMTQDQVANAMNVSQSAVARIESGKHEPTFSTLKAYAHAIGILPEQLDLSDD